MPFILCVSRPPEPHTIFKPPRGGASAILLLSLIQHPHTHTHILTHTHTHTHTHMHTHIPTHTQIPSSPSLAVPLPTPPLNRDAALAAKTQPCSLPPCLAMATATATTTNPTLRAWTLAVSSLIYHISLNNRTIISITSSSSSSTFSNRSRSRSISCSNRSNRSNNSNNNNSSTSCLRTSPFLPQPLQVSRQLITPRTLSGTLGPTQAPPLCPSLTSQVGDWMHMQPRAH